MQPSGLYLGWTLNKNPPSRRFSGHLRCHHSSSLSCSGLNCDWDLNRGGRWAGSLDCTVAESERLPLIAPSSTPFPALPSPPLAHHSALEPFFCSSSLHLFTILPSVSVLCARSVHPRASSSSSHHSVHPSAAGCRREPQFTPTAVIDPLTLFVVKHHPSWTFQFQEKILLT